MFFKVFQALFMKYPFMSCRHIENRAQYGAWVSTGIQVPIITIFLFLFGTVFEMVSFMMIKIHFQSMQSEYFFSIILFLMRDKEINYLFTSLLMQKSARNSNKSRMS